MNIKNTTTAIKVGSIKLRNDNNPNHIKIDWCVCDDILKDDAGRVYIITVNDNIMKIGGSQSKGGIKGTMSFYIGSMSGSPSLNRYGMQLLIKEQLDMDHKVDLHMIISKGVVIPVIGLFGETEQPEISFF